MCFARESENWWRHLTLDVYHVRSLFFILLMRQWYGGLEMARSMKNTVKELWDVIRVRVFRPHQKFCAIVVVVATCMHIYEHSCWLLYSCHLGTYQGIQIGRTCVSQWEKEQVSPFVWTLETSYGAIKSKCLLFIWSCLWRNWLVRKRRSLKSRFKNGRRSANFLLR